MRGWKPPHTGAGYLVKLRSKSSGAMPWNCDIPGGMPREICCSHLDGVRVRVRGVGLGVGAGHPTPTPDANPNPNAHLLGVLAELIRVEPA